MTSFDSVLSAANQLPLADRLRLIHALWNSVPESAAQPLSAEWEAEIDRRLDEFDRGSLPTRPWPEVRDEALARLQGQ
jgi:putative addiction module component (TIGR02574 family)